MVPRRREFHFLACDVSRFLVSTYASAKGYRVVWTDATACSSAALQRSDCQALWSVAGRVVSSELRDQRLAFMRSMQWIPPGEFALGAAGLQFIEEHQGQATSGEPWGVPACVGPLDKIALALAASSVSTGDEVLDALRLTASESNWADVELRFSEHLPDSDLASGVSSLNTARLQLEAADLAVFNELATQTPPVAGPDSTRWWRRR